MKLNISDSFNKELPADPKLENTRRQVTGAAFSFVTPRVPSAPKLVHAAKNVAEQLGFTQEDLSTEDFLKLVSGANVYPDTNPFAMCYGGHQFGNWAGQLGDGRAINLFEVEQNNKRWALQLKGAGETPYSRTADGLAVLRSSIREHLCSEAMHALGVPSTRSLSLSLTGDQVLRDMLYDGHPEYEKGAVVCRVSPSFVRFGNFEIFASRKDIANLTKLADYTIKHFYPEITTAGKEAYIAFFREVSNRTLDMIIHWERVGFVHGVMNTDNMSILGLTIDYGPYGWLEGYDLNWTPNTTDRQHRRYRFGKQSDIGLWNLYQLANALYPLIEEAEPLEKILENYRTEYALRYLKMMQAKLGLSMEMDDDIDLVESLEEVLSKSETDMTLFYRYLANLTKDFDPKKPDAISGLIGDAFYKPEEINGDTLVAWEKWFEAYLLRLNSEERDDAPRKTAMNVVNPKYVLRNYMAQLAIDAADNGDFTLVETLYSLLQNPYDEQPEHEAWFAKRPEWARAKVGCSMLSCSS